MFVGILPFFFFLNGVGHHGLCICQRLGMAAFLFVSICTMTFALIDSPTLV
jgi:hypothetical protein